jgi:hypothetical protein
VFDVAEGLVIAAEKVAIEDWVQAILAKHKSKDGRFEADVVVSFSEVGAVVEMIEHGVVHVYSLPWPPPMMLM